MRRSLHLIAACVCALSVTAVLAPASLARLPVRSVLENSMAATPTPDGRWIFVAGTASLGDWAARREARIDLFERVTQSGAQKLLWRASTDRIGPYVTEASTPFFSPPYMTRMPDIVASPNGTLVLLVAEERMQLFRRSANRLVRIGNYTAASFAGVALPDSSAHTGQDSQKTDPAIFSADSSRLYLLRPQVTVFDVTDSGLTLRQLEPSDPETGFGPTPTPLLGPWHENNGVFRAHGGSWQIDADTADLVGTMSSTPTTNPLDLVDSPPLAGAEDLAWLDIAANTLETGHSNPAWTYGGVWQEDPPMYIPNISMYSDDSLDLSPLTTRTGCYIDPGHQFLSLIDKPGLDTMVVQNTCSQNVPPGNDFGHFAVVDRDAVGTLTTRFADPPAGSGGSTIRGYDHLTGISGSTDTMLGYGDKGIAMVSIGSTSLQLGARTAPRAGLPRVKSTMIKHRARWQLVRITAPAWATRAVVFAGCGMLSTRYKVVLLSAAHKAALRWKIPLASQGCDFAHARMICVAAAVDGATDIENNVTCRTISIKGSNAGSVVN